MSRILIFFAAFTIANTSLGDPVVYPAKGQSPEQQKQDEAECYSWAVDRSGYDPAKPPSSRPATAQTSQRNKPTEARVRGALRGAAIGEIADGDTGDAAAARAIAADSRDRRERRRTNQQAQSAATQQRQAGQEAFNKARAACLDIPSSSDVL